MAGMLNLVWTWLNQHAALLLAIGLAVVLAWNLYRWAQDRQLAKELRENRSAAPRLDHGFRVSVLVAAWNEAEHIEEHIQAFLALTYPNKELILCAGGSDGTFQRALRFAGAGVTVIEQARGEGKQRALAKCLQQAAGELIFLTDADCLLCDDAFNRTLAPLLAGDSVTTGSSAPLQEQRSNPLVCHLWYAQTHDAAHMPLLIGGILGRNAAMTRRALMDIGGFDAEVHTGTDYHMAKSLLRCGYRIRYVRESEVATRLPDTPGSYRRRLSRWVRNPVVHARQFQAEGDVRQAVATMLSGWLMLVLPFTALIFGPLPLIGWLVLYGHSLLAKLRYAGFTRIHHAVQIPRRYLLAMPLYVILDYAAWAQPLLDLIFRRNRW